jgi:muramoyltetrapeptide carboxypeptidase
MPPGATTAAEREAPSEARGPPADFFETRKCLAFAPPPPLRRGDKIFVIAPSSAIAPEILKVGLAELEAFGFSPKIRPDILASAMDFAGPEERRLAELREALADPETKAVWAARGGYGAAYLLSHLKPDEIRAANKWLIGFSDITALHAAWGFAGLASMHGAVLSVLPGWTPNAKQELMDSLAGVGTEHVLEGTTVRPPLRPSGVSGSNRVTGRLAGGNLRVLASLVGTPHMPEWRGCIVILEDLAEQSYRVDRALLQLLQANAFDGVAGVALGHLTDLPSNEPKSATSREMALALLKRYLPEDIALLDGVPIGHEETSRPFQMGVVATLVAPEAGAPGVLRYASTPGGASNVHTG